MDISKQYKGGSFGSSAPVKPVLPNRQLEKSQRTQANRKKNNDCFIEKNINLQNLMEKKIPFNLFEFLKQFMVDTFLMKLTQDFHNGSKHNFNNWINRYFFISAGKSENYIPLSKLVVDQVIF